MSKHAALFRSLNLGDGELAVVVKDCIDIAGYPTVAGSPALATAAPALRNADVVDALLLGGCRIVGKANLHELAFGVTGQNLFTGSPRNPLYPHLVPGGSSSGSAVAVAEGLVDFAIGTDTGGSIRTPAACCGIVGLKPTFGRVSRKGASPQDSTLDCIGPLARTVAQIEQAMAIIAPGYTGVENEDLSFAVIRPGFVDPDVMSMFDRALASFSEEDLSADLRYLELAHTANLALIGHETFAAYGHLLASGMLGEDVARRLAAAATIGQREISEAERVRILFRQEVDALLDRFDVIVTPTMPCFPLALADAGDAGAALRMTALVRPFNLSGHPAITVPVITDGNAPIGIQVIGRHGEDEVVCAFARRLERSLARSDNRKEATR